MNGSPHSILISFPALYWAMVPCQAIHLPPTVRIHVGVITTLYPPGCRLRSRQPASIFTGLNIQLVPFHKQVAPRRGRTRLQPCKPSRCFRHRHKAGWAPYRTQYVRRSEMTGPLLKQDKAIKCDHLLPPAPSHPRSRFKQPHNETL